MPAPAVGDKIKVDTESHALGNVDPLEAYVALSGLLGADSVSLLESYAGPKRDSRVSMLLLAPALTLAVKGSRVEVTARPALLDALKARLARAGFPMESTTLEMGDRSRLWKLLRAVRDAFSVEGPRRGSTEFTFGFFGYLGYEVAWAIEELPTTIARTDPLPDVVLSLNSAHLAVDPATGKANLVTHFAEGCFEPPSRNDLIATINGAAPVPVGAPTVPAATAIETTLDKSDYLEAVDIAQRHIAAGDIYQAQIGHELRVSSEASPLDVYLRLRSRNPSPYMFLANMGSVTLVGASPEICVRVDGEQVCVRPIAGTIARGANVQEDEVLVSRLLTDEKEIAEHVMLIDLARNDVARVCKSKTLDVDELMVIEQYSHVSHMVSNVVGELRDDMDSFDAITSGFPAGTVSGAPKVRAMEIIESVEATQRGWYGGAVGLIDFGGYVVTALTLRSTAQYDGKYHLRASAGIVADSVGEREWQETLSKLAAPFWAVTGQEVSSARLGD